MGVRIKSMDKPKGCRNCPFYNDYIDHVHYVGYCKLNDKCIEDFELDFAPDWCEIEEDDN